MKKTVLLATLFLSACVSDVSIMNTEQWSGKEIRASQLCHKEGGHPATPMIEVTDIPDEANLILLAINNDSVPELSNGGLGIIGFRHTPGNTRHVLIPIPGERKSLPDEYNSFAFSEQKSRVKDKPFVYMPPCLRKKHDYSATVYSVERHGSFDQQVTNILKEEKVYLGYY
ncbi:MAG: hypothetical protein MJ250_02310 [Alphaproteobacteria bacterium]|nr:hypothetical protein [Alphaproteobacteria bacterium]